MFEKIDPISPMKHGRDAARLIDDDILIGSTDVEPDGLGRGGDALRAIEWGELKARLSAARDLRVLLRRDARLNIEANAASFGDAAATYFRAIEDSERSVNPDALEGNKVSSGMIRELNGDAATGDARVD